MVTAKRVRAAVIALVLAGLAAAGCSKVQGEPPRNVAQGILVTPVSRSTICHSTGSAALPFVEIAISDEAVSRHRDHAEDLIPAPAEGCPVGIVDLPGSSGGLPGGENPSQSIPGVLPSSAEPASRVEGCSPEDQTAAQFIQANDQMNQFEALLNETGWLSLLDGQVVITVLAPTDQAFARLTSRQQESMFNDEGSRNATVLYHLLLGQWAVSDLAGQHMMEMLSGELLYIGGQDNTLTLNFATTIVEADIPLCNGVVHMIDNVLVPPIFEDRRDVRPTATPQSRENRGLTPTPTRRPGDNPSAPSLQQNNQQSTTSVRPTLTPLPPQPSPTAQPTRTPVPTSRPTNTPRPLATNTPRPAATSTPLPAPTDSPPPLPPTSTPVPAPTATDVPPATNTPRPDPTDPSPATATNVPDTGDDGGTTGDTTTTGGTSDTGTTDGSTTGDSGGTTGSTDGSTTSSSGDTTGSTDGSTTGGDSGSVDGGDSSGAAGGSTDGGITGTGSTSDDGGLTGDGTTDGSTTSGTTTGMQRTVQTLAHWLADWLGVLVVYVPHLPN